MHQPPGGTMTIRDTHVDLGAILGEVNATGVVLPSQLGGILGHNVTAAEEGVGGRTLRNS